MDIRRVPDCRVSLDGAKLELEKDAQLTRVRVDLDADLFGECRIVFNDPQLRLINSSVSGAAMDSGGAPGCGSPG